ncbi:MAG: hypothetical protein ACE10I_06390 [Candidatus Acidiferrales bacterium]
MSTSVDWRRYLCCPACRAPLAQVDGGLECGPCSVRYEVTPAGVPILLTEEDRRRFATLLEQAAGSQMAE